MTPAAGPIVLAGAGKMGGAMLDGWLSSGIDAARIVVIDPFIDPAKAHSLGKRGVGVNPADAKLSGVPAVMVVAVKPQIIDDVLAALAAIAGKDTVVLSVAAGCPIARLANVFAPDTAIVRAMPNTPASIGKGITAAIGNAALSAGQRSTCDALLSAVGEVVWLASEDLMDAVTAVSGSGPAYVFLLAETLAAAGVAAGLDEATASRLARATVSGAGAMLEHDDTSAAQLRHNVTSPNGTTAAALAVLMSEAGGMGPLMISAVEAATKRSRELGK